MDQGDWQKMHLKDLLFLLPKISFFPNLHPEMFPEYVFERGFTNSASFFTEKRGASFSQFPLHNTFLSSSGPGQVSKVNLKTLTKGLFSGGRPSGCHGEI